MKKVILVLLCSMVLLNCWDSNIMASGRKIIIDEVKYNNTGMVSVNDVKEAIRTNSLANYKDKEKFINAETDDGKKFGDLVDISLTIMNIVQTPDYSFTIFEGEALNNPDIIYAAICEKSNDGHNKEEKITIQTIEKNNDKNTNRIYFYNHQKLADIINDAGIGSPISFEALNFGIKIETSKGNFVYTTQECTDVYGEKIKTDYYYLKPNAVYTYQDYTKWEETKQENHELWQSYMNTKPVTRIDEDEDVETYIPSEKSKKTSENSDDEKEISTLEEGSETEKTATAEYKPIIIFSDVGFDDPLYDILSRLAALEITEGYEDGTFRKEETITRAETTKMVLSAISSEYLAQAKRAQGIIGSGYSDVPRDHWAASYVNIATDQFGFIQGYGNGVFAPENHVTYAEVVKMLTCCLGYEDRAVAIGGWPHGYIMIAEEIGITKNISFKLEDAATRGDIARMIYNALDIPILYAITFEKRVDENGVETIEREYVIMDGDSNNGVGQTMLTWYQQAYIVKGVILGVSNKDVDMRIDESDNFNYIKVTAQNPQTKKFTNRLNDLSPLIDKEVYAVVQIKDDDFAIIEIQPVRD